MTDTELYLRVRDDAVAGDSSLANRVTVALLDALVARFGERFTIDGAVTALDDLIRITELWKAELQKAKSEAQP